jgi:hypothetical protein
MRSLTPKEELEENERSERKEKKNEKSDLQRRAGRRAI